MSRWWRAHDEAVDDPKLQLLPDALFKAWFNLCCLTSANGGKLPALKVIAFKLHMTEDKARHTVAELVARGLIDEKDGQFEPHNWNARQFKSDVSTERVQRHRKRKRNVSSNVSETPPEYRVQSTEAETEGNLHSPSPQVSNISSLGEASAKRETRSPPKHGQTDKNGHVYIASKTTDWDAYAADYRAAHGCDPPMNANGGKWFNTAGETPPDLHELPGFLDRRAAK